MQKIFNWIKSHKFEFFALVVILLIASFFRFYKIPDFFYFISDSGRDAQAAFKIIVDHKLTLVGPRASVAGFFLGPFYFYLIALPFWLFKFDPLGLAYFASFLGVVTVFLVYLLAKKLFGVKTALMAAFLYASGAIIINYSRMAWNPSPVPIFTILLLLCLVYFKQTNKLRWLLGVWVVFGLGIQLHYTFIYFLPFIAVYLFWIQRKIWLWLKELMIGFLVILLLNFPLIIFDIRHQFLTSRAFIDFLFGSKVSFSSFNFFGNFLQIIKQLFDLVILMGIAPIIKTIIILFLSVILMAGKRKGSISFLVAALLFSAFAFSFFKETIQLYYYNFLFPVAILLVANIVSIFLGKKYLKFLAVLFLVVFFWQSLKFNLNPPYPPRTLEEIRQVSLSIVKKVPAGMTFNIASFSNEPWYTAEEYRYFSYYFGKRAKGPEDYKNIDKLYVISSKPMDDPLAIKSQETVDFGATKVENSWTVGSMKVFQLSR